MTTVTVHPMRWIPMDGGRFKAGYLGTTDDCVLRSICIATGLDYRDTYRELFERAKVKAKTARKKRHGSPREGVHRNVYEPFLFEHGWEWTPTMAVGKGCNVHMRADELPNGLAIVRVSKHLTVTVSDDEGNGWVYDSHNPSRDGTRCVYGYYQPGDNATVSSAF